MTNTPDTMKYMYHLEIGIARNHHTPELELALTENTFLGDASWLGDRFVSGATGDEVELWQTVNHIRNFTRAWADKHSRCYQVGARTLYVHEPTVIVYEPFTGDEEHDENDPYISEFKVL